jgi:hypothetical protein
VSFFPERKMDVQRHHDLAREGHVQSANDSTVAERIDTWFDQKRVSKRPLVCLDHES